MAVQIHTAPLQAGNLRSTTPCRQSEAHDRCQVRRGGRNQAHGLLPYPPSVTLNLPRQQSDFGMVVDPLPFIPCHPENSPNRREIAIHCRRFDAPAQQPLADLPNHVPINISQTLLPQNRVKDSTDTLHISDASKRGFCFEIRQRSSRAIVAYGRKAARAAKAAPSTDK